MRHVTQLVNHVLGQQTVTATLVEVRFIKAMPKRPYTLHVLPPYFQVIHAVLMAIYFNNLCMYKIISLHHVINSHKEPSQAIKRTIITMPCQEIEAGV